jgi:Family of unknown function (DUF6527)
MRLTDLEPSWVGAGGEGVSDKDGNPIPERTGVAISFKCPCGAEDRVCIEFNNPLDGLGPHDPSRNLWNRTGDDFETLTVTPSIQRIGGCGWHGFITNGEVT